jgi:hypothetical protein
MTIWTLYNHLHLLITSYFICSSIYSEALEKAAAQERYWKLHQEGKTEQAKADLARLAIVRQQREEAAQKRLAEQEAKKAYKANPTPGGKKK